ncbi:MAG: hypothetical protein JSW27_11390 [Phycisphaerales bacterium]|nr:MAG: hypothetical protein JSW27_11390 [Phycisphaerales bacterium]
MNAHHRIQRQAVWLLVLAALTPVGRAQILHVDARTGDDGHPGTADRPLRSIAQAAILINARAEPGPATVVIGPGLYSLDQCVTFAAGRTFSEQERLTIRASVLPDDPRWKPEAMPTILSIENPKQAVGSNMPSETYSLKIQTSHVTVAGLRFLGNPSLRNWHCCIERIGEDLDDLVVTQCMFMGDPDTANIYCAALATGDRFVVDHCVFSKCHGCTVFWDGLDGIGGKGCAMRSCIVTGAFISGVWTCQTAEDFEFHHNVIADCEYIWMRKAGDRQRYRIRDCAVVGNQYFSGYGRASGPIGPTGSEVAFDRDKIITDGRLVFTSDAKTHLAKESIGYALGAGLFTHSAEQDGKQ